MPLVNLKPDKDTDWLGKGTAETLTTNLMKVSALVLIERMQIDKVLLEQDMQKADFSDPKTAVKVGKIVGAERVLVGSYAKEGQAVLFNVRMVDVETGIILQAASVQGDWSKIFDLMTQLAIAVIDSFDKKAVIVESRPVAADAPRAERIVLTGEQSKRLKDWGTTNRDAFEAYSRGKSANDPNTKLPWYTRAIEIDQKYSWAYTSRANTYLAKGGSDKAIQDYGKAIDLDPQDARVYYNRGLAYNNRSEPDKAIKDFDKAIDLDPRYAEAYGNRGIAYRAKGESDEAIRDYGKAIELDPKDPSPYNNRGLAYCDKGEFDKAIKDHEKAIELVPKYAGVYYNRGLAYWNKGDFDRATKDFDKAIELDPRLALAYESRGMVYYDRRLYDKAWVDVRACQRLGGNVDATFLDKLRKVSGRSE
jgi:Tfp pilus assembly protein PilF/TolB-like protein